MRPQGFPASRRLRGAARFDQVFRSGTRRSGRFFVVHAFEGAESSGSLGLVVARKITRTNVLRNRLKRLIREMFRTSSPSVRRFDLIVRVRTCPSPEHWNFARSELRTLLDKLP